MEPRSVRLNSSNRDKFVREVMGDMLPQENKPNLDDFLNRKWPEIFAELYGPFEETIAALPNWMKYERTQMNVLFDREVLTIAFIEKINVPQGTGRLDKHHSLVQELNAFKQQIKDWDTKRQELYRELTKVVTACNSSAQLYATWPKSLEYAEKCFPYKGPVTAPKPVVSTDALELTLKIVKSTIGSPDEN